MLPNLPRLKTWPLLGRFYSKGSISYLEYAFVEKICSDYDHHTESLAALLCHLLMSAKNGHLCIKIEEGKVSPDVRELWSQDGSEDKENQDVAGKNDFQELEKLILEGFFDLPGRLVTDCSVADLALIPATPLCRYMHMLYLQRFWYYETLFLKHFQTVCKSSPSLKFDQTIIKQQIDLLEGEGKLLPEQAEAILKSSNQCLSFISGGPGTGKTYTAGQIICVFWQAMNEDQRKKWRIALAAPTGKAAANLQKSLERAMGSNIAGFRPPQASTLHSLLGIRGNGVKRDDTPQKISADLILVDECSMIDAKMMGQLLSAIKPGARLILLGDKHQLPPVATGAVFSDLVTCLQSDAVLMPIELKVCLRAELKGIVDFASAINAGSMQALEPDHFEGVSRLCFDKAMESTKQLQQALLHHVVPLFPHAYSLENPLSLFHRFNHFRLLSPLRKGYCGVNEMNHLIFNEFKKNAKNQPFITPIMLTNNDMRLGLFNGEVGLLVRNLRRHDLSDLECRQGDYALFLAADGGIRKLPALLLPKFELAYCLSVHKSQGSEFEHVLLVMPKGSEVFGREVFYTAATRARKRLEIWGDDEIIRQTIARQSKRLSGVYERFFHKFHKSGNNDIERALKLD